MNAVTPEVRRGIIERMVLAKLLLSQGLALCADASDPMRFSQGLLSLQDALELALGAMATFVDARLEPKTAFYDYFRKINDKLKAAGKTELPSQKDLMLLNDARVKVKHHGLVQRPEDQQKHTIHVEPFIRHVCGLMDIDLDNLSLCDAIGSEKVRDVIREAEAKLSAEDFKGCAQALAMAQYHLFGYRFNIAPYNDLNGLLAPGPAVHWEDFKTDHEVWLIRHGIDVAGFYRLRCLIPTWGVTAKKHELVFWWEDNFCHPGNWSRGNMRQGINFTIDMAIKLERPHPGQGLVPRVQFLSHKITAIKGDATFWNHNKVEDELDETNRFPPPRHEILKLKKGESIEGFAWRTKDNPTTWMISSDALEGGGGIATAYEVDVQEVPREQAEAKAPAAA